MKKYSRSQIKNTIQYWQRRLDEGVEFDNIKDKDVKDTKSAAKAALKVLSDDTYDEFVDDLNTLMSADKDGKVGRMKNALIKMFNGKKLGDSIKISFGPASPKVSEFMATQNEVCISNSLINALYKNDKVPGMTCEKQAQSLFPDGGPGGTVQLGPPILAAKVGNQYYVIDGHHRWSQAYCFNPEAQLAAYVIECPKFKTGDDVLKFVQMQIMIKGAREKNLTQLPASKGSGSPKNNLFQATPKQIKSKCLEYMKMSENEFTEKDCSVTHLYPPMMKCAGKKAGEEKFAKKMNFIANQILKNVELLKGKGEMEGSHDRAIMPQAQDKALGSPKQDSYLNKKNAGVVSKFSDTLGESRRYSPVQIQEAIRHWKRVLAEKNLVAESLTNKLLGWFGIRSNYTEFEDLVSDIANKKAQFYKVEQFADNLANDDDVVEFKKSIRGKADADDFSSVLKDVLRKKMGSRVQNSRYAEAIDFMGKILAASFNNNREYLKQLEDEFQAELAADKEKAKKDAEAEYGRKHGNGYADINRHRGNATFYEPGMGGYYTGKSRLYR